MELFGRVVIVTGASSGIGAETARAFVGAGARVVLAARSAERLDVLAGALGAEHALVVPTDVTDGAQVGVLVERTLAHFGRIDVLVNNAGVGLSGAVATLNVEYFQRIMAVNVLGPLAMIQAVVPHMRRPDGGVIINISSMVTKLTIPTIGGYRASKYALNALSENARVELAREHIRVVSVYPNVTDTAFFEHTLGASEGSRFSTARMRRHTPAFVAQRIVAGARSEPREVFMSRADRVFALMGVLFPQMIERMISGRMR